jgi:hypothetical protein
MQRDLYSLNETRAKMISERKHLKIDYLISNAFSSSFWWTKLALAQSSDISWSIQALYTFNRLRWSPLKSSN